MGSERIVEAVEASCRRNGWRLTPVRRRVLELVVAADGPVKAYDLLDQLKRTHASAAPPTVYRALDFLLEHHFIHRLESVNAFVNCFHPEKRHHSQFLICERCESVTEISNPGLAGSLESAARDEGFAPQRQVVEVYGVCGKCEVRD